MKLIITITDDLKVVKMVLGEDRDRGKEDGKLGWLEGTIKG